MRANRKFFGLAAVALLLVLLLACALVAGVVLPQWNVLTARFFPETIRIGFVIIDGQYVAGPYTVDATDGNLSLNGTVVRRLPLETPPTAATNPAPTSPAPANPQTAPDLIKFALAHLRAKGVTDFRYIPPALRLEVVDLLKTYPAAAAVIDDGAEIVVTDRAGLEAGLLLDAPPELPREALVANQVTRAEGWKRLLKSGGVLLLIPGAEVDVPAQKSAAFLNALLAVFDQVESARLKPLTDLVHVPQLAEALLKAGAPPARLRQPVTPSPVPATRQALQNVSPARAPGSRLFAPLSDDGSHKLSLTPGSSVAYFFQTIILESGEEASAKEAAQLHGYIVIVFEADYRLAIFGGTVKGPGTSTIENFLSTSGAAGILYISTHGGKGSIDIEEYTDEDAGTAAYLAYARGTPPVTGIRFESVPGSRFTDHWAVALSEKGVRSQWKGLNTIVELTTCWGWTMHDAFRASGAREFIGAIREVIEADPVKTWNEDFWGRLAGTLDDGVRRNVGDAAADVFAGTIFKYDGEKLTVLSPAVARVSPPDGTSVGVGWVVNAQVVFDAPIDTLNNLPIQLTGPCAPDFVSSYTWDAAGRTLSFTFTTRSPGRVKLAALSSVALSDSNSVALDGNDNGQGKSHVDGNGDDYAWQLTCDPNQPTPTVTVTPPPSATPSESPSPTDTPSETPSMTPTATKTPTKTATPTATPKPTATGTGSATATLPPIAGAYLMISATIETTTYYEVHFTDPALEARRNEYTYVWGLTLPVGDACNSQAFAANSPSPWLAPWSHPGCNHSPDEKVGVVMRRKTGGSTVTMLGPALGPARADAAP